MPHEVGPGQDVPGSGTELRPTTMLGLRRRRPIGTGADGGVVATVAIVVVVTSQGQAAPAGASIFCLVAGLRLGVAGLDSSFGLLALLLCFACELDQFHDLCMYCFRTGRCAGLLVGLLE